MRRCRVAQTLGSALVVFMGLGCDASDTRSNRAPAATGSEAITADSVRAHVVELAGDALEGRGAGYAGEVRAASYIEHAFQLGGLETSVQTFGFLPRAPEEPGTSLTSRNVLALLPGSDPRLAGEIVCLGAHHDGQGKAGQADAGRYRSADPAGRTDAIWNSADDNASSVAAVLEIARVLAARSSRPRRAILFATFGAEEHALNGSAHLARHPWPAGARVCAMVNLEKIGRVPDKPLVMAGCATSPVWADVLRSANAGSETVECLLPELVPDTDHYPFGALGIPAVVLGTVHEDDTHQPTDDSSKLDFRALARRARYVLDLVELLANRESLPGFDPETQRGIGMVAVAASPAERRALALGERGALKVSVALPGLPAANAGLRVGDFVTALDGKPLDPQPNERLIQEALGDGSVARLTVRRGASELVVDVEPRPSTRGPYDSQAPMKSAR